VASAAELFKVKKQEEGNLSWILRGVGWLVMFIGLMLIARPISMVLAFLPFLEGIAETGAFLIALMVSLPLTLLIIAIAWIVHRPILGVGLLVAAGALFWLLKGMRRKPAVAISR
ncbi:MAG TPA: TMEM43 family protein, partial [Burkholderiaceae bacterium]|nr:TMEM43 family protein [Burkholderiaceae bacterium]